VPTWSVEEVPDLTGKTVLVTGASGGIGFEAARVFARAGATVVLAARDPGRGQAALGRIAMESPGASLQCVSLDLASLASVREAARRVIDQHGRLDVLCNNAGVMAIPRVVTEDGFEMQLGVNHFGHFALTGLLLESMLEGEAARIVTVSSTAHRIGRMQFDDLDGERAYQKWGAYAQSKLANLLFAYELERRLRAAHVRAVSIACHPGYANTNLQLVGPARERSRLGLAFFRVCNAVLAQPAFKGAWPTVYASTAPDVRGGDYIGPGGPAEIAGRPVKVESSRASHDRELARKLWEVSVQRTGVDYAVLEGPGSEARAELDRRRDEAR
jgi:NAD(P)-dependent dehydrogenase (short-subunit alcohol dehydrogenase family)